MRAGARWWSSSQRASPGGNAILPHLGAPASFKRLLGSASDFARESSVVDDEVSDPFEGEPTIVDRYVIRTPCDVQLGTSEARTVPQNQGLGPLNGAASARLRPPPYGQWADFRN